jgi:hypothetical protein
MVELSSRLGMGREHDFHTYLVPRPATPGTPGAGRQIPDFVRRRYRAEPFSKCTTSPANNLEAWSAEAEIEVFPWKDKDDDALHS